MSIDCSNCWPLSLCYPSAKPLANSGAFSETVPSPQFESLPISNRALSNSHHAKSPRQSNDSDGVIADNNSLSKKDEEDQSATKVSVSIQRTRSPRVIIPFLNTPFSHHEDTYPHCTPRSPLPPLDPRAMELLNTFPGRVVQEPKIETGESDRQRQWLMNVLAGRASDRHFTIKDVGNSVISVKFPATPEEDVHYYNKKTREFVPKPEELEEKLEA